MAKESREAWGRRVGRWERSGQTATEFAAREGVNPRTLSFWKWKLGRSKLPSSTGRRPSVDFVEVIPEAVLSHDAPLEIVVERYRVRLDRRTDEATLARVLDAVRGRT
jgi:transposase